MTLPHARSCRSLLVLLAVASLAACSRGDGEGRPATPVVARRASASHVDSLGAGDVRIVTTDGAIDLALIGDTISTGMSPTALAKVRAETDTAQVSGSGIGASFEKLVKRTVANNIGTRAAFPVSAVRDVRYEAGALRFDWSGEPPKIFVQMKVNGRPVLESFPPADAERFAAAVRARKGTGGAAF